MAKHKTKAVAKPAAVNMTELSKKLAALEAEKKKLIKGTTLETLLPPKDVTVVFRFTPVKREYTGDYACKCEVTSVSHQPLEAFVKQYSRTSICSSGMEAAFGKELVRTAEDLKLFKYGPDIDED